MKICFQCLISKLATKWHNSFQHLLACFDTMILAFNDKFGRVSPSFCSVKEKKRHKNGYKFLLICKFLFAILTDRVNRGSIIDWPSQAFLEPFFLPDLNLPLVALNAWTRHTSTLSSLIPLTLLMDYSWSCAGLGIENFNISEQNNI